MAESCQCLIIIIIIVSDCDCYNKFMSQRLATTFGKCAKEKKNQHNFASHQNQHIQTLDDIPILVLPNLAIYNWWTHPQWIWLYFRMMFFFFTSLLSIFRVFTSIPNSIQCSGEIEYYFPLLTNPQIEYNILNDLNHSNGNSVWELLEVFEEHWPN